MGWVNLDETKPGDVLSRVPPAPFQDKCFDEILMSHVVEHMTLDGGRALMKECHRILNPGGVATVIVSYGKIISLAHLAGQINDWKLNAWLLCSYCQESQHNRLYDRRTLTQIVAEAGFVGLRRLNRFTDPPHDGSGLVSSGTRCGQARYVDIGEQLRIRPCIPGAMVSAPGRTF